MIVKKNLSNIRIILLNWNNGDVILDCLRSIEKAGYISSVVVVDNASNDGSVGKIRSQSGGRRTEVKIIKNRENLGYAEGNNTGIRFFLKRKEIKYILILNPDTKIEKDMIRILHEEMQRDKSIGIAGPKILDKEGKIWSCGGVIDKKRFSGGLTGLGEEDHGQYDQMKDADYIPGTAMMVRREVFEKVGLFEEKYFIYYEDAELSAKTKQAGYKTVYIPGAIVHHLESTSFGRQSKAHSYYMARNHLLFVERNAPVAIKLRELIRLPKTIWEHLSKGEESALLGIRNYFLRRFGRYDNWS